MAKKTQSKEREVLPQLSYDWYGLGNARVAGQYLSQGEEGVPYARKSLELILKDAGIKDSWIVNTVTDPEVLHKTISNQLETFNQYNQDQTVGDLFARYEGDLEKYLGEDSAELELAHERLGAFEEEKYADINKKIAEAKYVLEGKKKFDRGSDEDVEKANKVIEKYSVVPQTFSRLEQVYAGRFRTRVEEELTSDYLKAIYSPKETKN